MKKIAKIIDTCLDCIFFLAVEHKSGAHFGICDFIEETEEKAEYKPSILIRANDKPSHYKMDIPDNCPLETYKEL